jgi:putative DNA primase/helicase
MTVKFKTPFHISISSFKSNFKNTVYESFIEVEDLEMFDRATQFDHVMGSFIDNKRSVDNFDGSDCLFFDIDNGGSENSNDWVSMDMVPELFPDVEMILKPSKNHMKVKKGKPARPKFHGYCPLKEIIKDGKELEQYLNIMINLWTELDAQVNDCSRFFAGSATGGAVYIHGTKDMVEFLQIFKENDYNEKYND